MIPIPATSSEPTAEDLRTAVAQLTGSLAAAREVNAALLGLVDEKNREIRICHDEIRRLAYENEDLTRARDRQQRLDDPPRRRPFGLGNSL